MRVFLLLFLFIVSLSSVSQAAETFTELQSGALMGEAHLSFGITTHDRHNLMAGVGYVRGQSNHAEMSLFSAQYLYNAPLTFDIGSWRWQPFNFGIGLIKGNHDKLFTSLPDQYPDGYYPPSALHFLFTYQNRLQINQHWQAFFNITTMDVALLSYVRQSDFYMEEYRYFGLSGITTWGLGVRYAF